MKLVERGEFLASLQTQLTNIETDEGHCVFVSGEAGISSEQAIKQLVDKLSFCLDHEIPKFQNQQFNELQSNLLFCFSVLEIFLIMIKSYFDYVKRKLMLSGTSFRMRNMLSFNNFFIKII